MPEINVEVYCSCGEGLCKQTSVKRGTDLIVEPCEDCLNAKGEKEYNKGYKEGYSEGIKSNNPS